MPRKRGSEHSSLTQTATLLVRELEKLPGIKMIAPGIITTGAKSGGKRYVSAVYTTAGMELIVTGQSIQKIAVHTDKPEAVIATLKESKKLKAFNWNERERKPGI